MPKVIFDFRKVKNDPYIALLKRQKIEERGSKQHISLMEVFCLYKTTCVRSLPSRLSLKLFQIYLPKQHWRGRKDYPFKDSLFNRV